MLGFTIDGLTFPSNMEPENFALSSEKVKQEPEGDYVLVLPSAVSDDDEPETQPQAEENEPQCSPAKVKREPSADFVLHLPPATAEAEALFKCDECPHQTKYKSNLTAHKGTHNKSNECETCEKKFSAKQKLKNHQMQHKHGAFATKPAKTFACGKCEKSFSSPAYLKDHQRKIHDEKQVKCGVCNKILKNRDSLQEHLQTHAKLECSICHKMITKYKMALHKRMHSAVNLFQCHLCNYSTKRKGNLGDHIERAHLLKQLADDSTKDDFDNFELLAGLRLKHGIVAASCERQFKCEFCEKSFAYLKLLKQHKRHVHSE